MFVDSFKLKDFKLNLKLFLVMCVVCLFESIGLLVYEVLLFWRVSWVPEIIGIEPSILRPLTCFPAQKIDTPLRIHVLSKLRVTHDGFANALIFGALSLLRALVDHLRGLIVLNVRSVVAVV